MRNILPAFLVVLLLSTFARADGLIIVETPERVPGHFAFAPLEVRFHRVSVEIEDDVAVTSVDQEFYNPSSRATEGTYIFPLPAGAHIDKFSIDINGRQVEAELLDAQKARQIYEDIVRKMRDPALLEYAGRGAFKARIFPIEAHSTKRVQIKYTQMLKPDSGLSEYMYPLNTEKFSSRPVGEVSVNVRVRSRDPLKAVTCPTHDARIQRDQRCRSDRVVQRPQRAAGHRLQAAVQPRSQRDGPAADDVQETRRERRLLHAPRITRLADEEARDTQGKDIIFVLDTSGSMAEQGKLEQAKRALTYCLANLRAQDNFNIVRFSTEAELLHPALTSADDAEKVAAAKKWLNDLKPTGGTAIDDALAAALKLRPADREGVARRPFIVVFLTDGLPTIGVSNENELVKRALDRAGAGCRIFCFGLGNDVNTHLLDRLSDSTRAVSAYVAPSEDLEIKLASFYDKVNDPAVTDVRITFDGGAGIQTTQLYPTAMPDLFKGQTLQLFGKYKGNGPASVKLSGLVGGERREFAEDVTFTERDERSTFIPMMWATRRVGWLLDEMRQHGESSELKDEVVKLAREHGIVTPYTAYLITEDEAKRNVPVTMRGFERMRQDKAQYDRAKDAYDSTQREAQLQSARSGAQAVDNAAALNGMKYADNASAAAQGAGMPITEPSAAGYKAQEQFAQQARNIAGRTFYQNGPRWVDSDAQRITDNAKQRTIRFNSDEYFALLRDHPDAAPWLALSNEVDVVIDETLYQVRDN